jgi:hypothetical protein
LENLQRKTTESPEAIEASFREAIAFLLNPRRRKIPAEAKGDIWQILAFAQKHGLDVNQRKFFQQLCADFQNLASQKISLDDLNLILKINAVVEEVEFKSIQETPVVEKSGCEVLTVRPDIGKLFKKSNHLRVVK